MRSGYEEGDIASFRSEAHASSAQRGTKCYSNLCQLVFHPGRNLGINCAQHNSIALKFSQVRSSYSMRWRSAVIGTSSL